MSSRIHSILSALFLLVSYASLPAQAKRDSIKQMLVGSWAFVNQSSQVNIASLELTSCRLITFYADGRFQEELADPQFKTWRILAPTNRWNIGRKRYSIKLHRIKKLTGNYSFFSKITPLNNPCTLLKVSKDSLVLSVQSYMSGTKLIDSTLFFKRINLRKLRAEDQPNPSDLTLVNTTDTNKIVFTPSNNSTITLQLKNDTLSEYADEVSGTFLRTLGDTIEIENPIEHFYYTDKEGKEHRNETIEKGNTLIENKHSRLYLAKNIISLKLNQPKHPKIYFIGELFSALAAVSTLIVSPVFALSPDFNKFDAHRYLAFGGISVLAGLTIGVPLLAIGQGPSTDYFLDPAFANKNNALCWRIKPFHYE